MIAMRSRMAIDVRKPLHAVALALVATVAIVGAAPAARGQDAREPHFGVWRLNVEKSTFESVAPLKAQTPWYEPFGYGAIRVRVETFNADDTRTVGGYTAYLDGHDYPTTDDDSEAITIALRRTSRNTIDGILKSRGIVVLRTTNAVSEDGRVMTLTERGTMPDGRAFTNVQVYERVQ